MGFQRVLTLSLLAFDTGTTGLAGGTRAFMIGAAGWNSDELRVRQLYLTTLGAEVTIMLVGRLNNETSTQSIPAVRNERSDEKVVPRATG